MVRPPPPPRGNGVTKGGRFQGGEGRCSPSPKSCTDPPIHGSILPCPRTRSFPMVSQSHVHVHSSLSQSSAAVPDPGPRSAPHCEIPVHSAAGVRMWATEWACAVVLPPSASCVPYDLPRYPQRPCLCWIIQDTHLACNALCMMLCVLAISWVFGPSIHSSDSASAHDWVIGT